MTVPLFCGYLALYPSGLLIIIATWDVAVENRLEEECGLSEGRDIDFREGTGCKISRC